MHHAEKVWKVQLVNRMNYLLMESDCVRVTMPTAVYGYCVVSLTRTLVSFDGQPSQASVGFRLVLEVVCSSCLCCDACSCTGACC